MGKFIAENKRNNPYPSVDSETEPKLSSIIVSTSVNEVSQFTIGFINTKIGILRAVQNKKT
jgi:hypothetical protein